MESTDQSINTSSSGNAVSRFLDRLYGGIKMNWPAVIIMAVVSAAITAVFLLVPVFKDTSFERMGIDFEAWFLPAILIMPNCKSPLDSAVKTFVFFLVSQPLIYLIQVPFSDMGWGLFGYYKYWFIWTLLTFPMAFIGWFLRKRGWISLLIISPVIVFLSAVGVGAFIDTYYEPPYLLVTGLFCMLQAAVYILTFTVNKWQRLAALAAVIVTAVIVIVRNGSVEISGQSFLPEGYSYSENAVITVADPDIAEVSFNDPAEGFVYVNGRKYGSTTFTVTDGGKEQRFSLEIYRENGHSQLEIKAE